MTSFPINVVFNRNLEIETANIEATSCICPGDKIIYAYSLKKGPKLKDLIWAPYHDSPMVVMDDAGNILRMRPVYYHGDTCQVRATIPPQDNFEYRGIMDFLCTDPIERKKSKRRR